MAASDAAYYAKRNQPRRITFALRDASGDLVSGAAGLDAEVSKDAGAFGDCVNEATEIGSTGIYYLDLTAGEMDAATVVVQVKSSSAKTHVEVMPTVDVDLTDLGDRLGPWTGDNAKSSIYGALRAMANSNETGFECSDLIRDDGEGAGDFVPTASLQGIRTITALAIVWEDAAMAQAGSGSSSIVAPGSFSATNDKYNHGHVIVFTGAAAGDVRTIIDYVGATRTIVPDRDFSAAIGAGDIFFILRGTASGLSTAERAAVVDAVWDELKSDHMVSASMGRLANDIETSLTILSTFLTLTGVSIKTGGITATSFANNAITTNALADGAITASKIGSDAITAAKVAADVHEEAAEVLLDRPNAVETGWSLRGFLRVIGAVLAGKSTGVDVGSPVYRNLTDTKTRVSASASNGNRSSVTYDQS